MARNSSTSIMAMVSSNSRAIAWALAVLTVLCSRFYSVDGQPAIGLSPALLPLLSPAAASSPFVHLNGTTILSILDVNVSNQCSENSGKFLNEILKMFNSSSSGIQEWALKMVDASAKIPTGILEGNLKWLGSFSECLKINNEGLFSGQYCTATLTNQSSELATLFPKSSPLSKLLACNCVTVGICWPSSCNESEIQQLINAANLPLSIQSGSCQVETPKNFDASTVAVIVIYCFFTMILLIGTFVDVFMAHKKCGSEELRKPGVLRHILTSFSIIKNGKKLLSTKTGGESLTCIHGMRLLSFFWVVLGHTYDYASMMPIKNPLDITKAVDSVAFNVIINGTYSVDTFLFLSGFLITYLGLKQMRKSGGKLNIFMYYFHRYWRLTPLYAMVIAFIAGPYYLLGSGPQWPMMLNAQQNCRDYWWRNLLYINNLWDTAHICIDVSWYISIDMQFYLIMPIVLFSLYKIPLLGYVIISLLFIITTVTPALYIHYHNIPGYPGREIIFNGNSPAAIDYQSNVYIKSYCRMGPYLVGICLAYFLYKRDLRVKLSWWKNVIGWILAAGLGLILIYGTYGYFDGEKVMSNALNSVYGALSRPAWGLCVGWVVFVCVTGNGGFVNTILSWRGMIPLGRLTYGGYLIHLSILFLLFGTQEVAYYFQEYLVVVIYCGFLVIIMGVSFLFSIAFESPMLELEKVLFSRHTKRNKSRTSRRSSDHNRQKTSEPMEEIGEVSPKEIDHAQNASYQNEAYIGDQG
ncbi:hypothetical protein CHUAL_003252 [Chamberlinius hualienensis]